MAKSQTRINTRCRFTRAKSSSSNHFWYNDVVGWSTVPITDQPNRSSMTFTLTRISLHNLNFKSINVHAKRIGWSYFPCIHVVVNVYLCFRQFVIVMIVQPWPVERMIYVFLSTNIASEAWFFMSVSASYGDNTSISPQYFLLIKGYQIKRIVWLSWKIMKRHLLFQLFIASIAAWRCIKS